MATIQELFEKNKSRLFNSPKIKNSVLEEPFEFTTIEEGEQSPLDFIRKYQSRFNPSYALLVDSSRISKLLATGRGLTFLAKQGVLGSRNASEDARSKYIPRLLLGSLSTRAFYPDIKADKLTIEELNAQ